MAPKGVDLTLNTKIENALYNNNLIQNVGGTLTCLLYTSDAADDLLCVDLGGRRNIKKKNHR